MNHKNKLTDEEILGYLLGDCEVSLKTIIENKIGRDLKFKKRVESLSLIHKQIHSSPVDCFIPEKRALKVWNLIPTCSLLMFSFLVGLYIEARFIFLGSEIKDNSSVTTETIISKPLDWDEKSFSSLM